MNEFQFYLNQGINHILDPNGIDHFLFVISIAIIYQVSEWKKLVTVITAFTIGHSITLALAALDVVKFSSSLVELLIPITILITCLSNIFKVSFRVFGGLHHKFTYLLVLLFGLIHGMGFSTFFKSMLMEGDNLIFQLFSFNFGIEVGQLAIVAVLFGVIYLLKLIKPITYKLYVIVISSLIGLKALQLIVENIIT